MPRTDDITTLRQAVADLSSAVKNLHTDFGLAEEKTEIKIAQLSAQLKAELWSEIKDRISQFTSFFKTMAYLLGLVLVVAFSGITYLFTFADTHSIFDRLLQLSEKLDALHAPNSRGASQIHGIIESYLEKNYITLLPADFTIRYDATSTTPYTVEFAKANSTPVLFRCEITYAATGVNQRPHLTVTMNDLDEPYLTIQPSKEGLIKRADFSIRETNDQLFPPHHYGNKIWNKATFSAKNPNGITGWANVKCAIIHLGPMPSKGVVGW